MFHPHPSTRLNQLFGEKPYQGVAPEAAEFLFIGLDANYDPAIEHGPIFPRIEEYHRNGTEFWRKYCVHHPFLLQGYSGDGKRYHGNFAKLGFGPEHAALVSFAELLHVPTTGRSKLTSADLSERHLATLNSAILEGRARHIFVSAGVLRLMRETRTFDWLPENATNRADGLSVLRDRAGKSIYLHLHFSNYGKFQKQMDIEAGAIRALISPAPQ